MRVSVQLYYCCLALVFQAGLPAVLPAAFSQGSAGDQSTGLPESGNASVRFDDLGRRLVVISGKSELTGQVVDSVAEGLSLLPSALKQRFIATGVTIVVTPALEKPTNESGGTRL